jgi:hypothetical protein
MQVVRLVNHRVLLSPELAELVELAVALSVAIGVVVVVVQEDIPEMAEMAEQGLMRQDPVAVEVVVVVVALFRPHQRGEVAG